MNSYTVEWDTRTGISEVQRITLAASAPPSSSPTVISGGSVAGLSGYFRLSFGGQTTALLSSTASPADVQAALMSLSAIGNVAVSSPTSTAAVAAAVWVVTFVSNVGPQPLLALNTDSLSGTGGVSANVTRLTPGTWPPAFAASTSTSRAVVSSGRVDVLPAPTIQLLTVSAAAQDLDGTFAVKFGAGSSSSGTPINVNDTAAQLAAKLGGVAGIGSVDVTRVLNSGTAADACGLGEIDASSAVPGTRYGSAWRITFSSSVPTSTSAARGGAPLLLVSVDGGSTWGASASGGSLSGTAPSVSVSYVARGGLPLSAVVVATGASGCSSSGSSSSAPPTVVVRVTPFGSDGSAGSASIAPYSVTLSPQAPGPVRHAQISSSGPSSAIAWWSPPAQSPSAPVFEYVIQRSTSPDFPLGGATQSETMFAPQLSIGSNASAMSDCSAAASGGSDGSSLPLPLPSPSLSYTLTNLPPHTHVFVRVLARNRIGYSSPVLCQPLAADAAPVLMLIVYDAAGGSVSSGQFRISGLCAEGCATPPLSVFSTSAEVAAALASVPGVGPVDVMRVDQRIGVDATIALPSSSPHTPGLSWLITFRGAIATPLQLSALLVLTPPSNGSPSLIHSEIASVSVLDDGSGAGVSGYFALSLGGSGVSSACVRASGATPALTASALQAALLPVLPSISASCDGVNVSAAPATGSLAGTMYTLVFSPACGNVPSLVAVQIDGTGVPCMSPLSGGFVLTRTLQDGPVNGSVGGLALLSPSTTIVALTALRSGSPFISVADPVYTSPAYTVLLPASAAQLPPPPPSSISLVVVSDTELGVTWTSPAGSLLYSKYRVEWDTAYQFGSSDAEDAAAESLTSVVIDGAHCNPTVCTWAIPSSTDYASVTYSYKIGSVGAPLSTGVRYFVRVSAFTNGSLFEYSSSAVGVYGPPALSSPQTGVPTAQYAPAPSSVLVSPSSVALGATFRNVPTQLDISVSDAVFDAAGFRTRDGYGSGVSSITAWRIEYDTAPTFDSGANGGPLGLYDDPNFNHGSDGLSVGPAPDATRDCSQPGGCLIHLGAELDAVTLSTITGPFSSGSYRLLVGANSTGCIPVNATAAQVEVALAGALAPPGAPLPPASVMKRISATPPSGGSYVTYYVLWDAPYSGGDVPPLSVSVAGCAPFGGSAGSSGFAVTPITLYGGGQLAPGTEYYVRARAINAVGVSPWATTQASGFPTAPSGLPSDSSVTAVYAVRDDDGALRVTWSPPASDSGSPIIGCYVTYAAVGGGALCGGNGSIAACPWVPAPASQWVLTGLTPGVPLDVRVVAVNGRGGSSNGLGAPVPPACEPDLQGCIPLSVPRALPAQPVNIALGAAGGNAPNSFTASSMLLSWSAGNEDGNVNATSFIVEWDASSGFNSGPGGQPSSWSASARSSPVVLAYSSGSTSTPYYFNITGLVPGVRQYVRVTAVNTLGHGSPSAITLGRPLAAPGKPTTVVLSTLSLGLPGTTTRARGTSLVVSFSPPASLGGDVISAYAVAWATQPFATGALSAYVRNTQSIALFAQPGVAASIGSIGGTFTLSVDTTSCVACIVRAVHTTASIPAAADAWTVKLALQALPNAGAVDVSLALPPFIAAPFNSSSTPTTYLRVWSIVFVGASVLGPLSPLSIDASGLFSLNSPSSAPGVDPALGTGSPFGMIHDVYTPGAEVAGAPPAGLCGGSLAGMAGCVYLSADALASTPAPYSLTLTGLAPGVPVFVIVSASSSTMGYGPYEVTAPLSVSPPKQPPDAPVSPFLPSDPPLLSLASSSSLRVAMAPPAFDGGDTVVKYKVEWDTSPSFDSTPFTALPLGWAEIDTPAALGDVITPSAYTEYTIAMAPGAFNVTRYAPAGPQSLLQPAPAAGAVSMALSSGSPLFVRVYAYNAAGRWSTPVATSPVFLTPRGRPGAPLALSLAPVSPPASAAASSSSSVSGGAAADPSTSLLLSWASPLTNGGGAVTGYKLEWFTQSSSVASLGPSTPSLATCDHFGCREVQTLTFTEVIPSGGGAALLAASVDLDRDGSVSGSADSTMDGTFTIAFGGVDTPLPGTVSVILSSTFSTALTNAVPLPAGTPIGGSFSLAFDTSACADADVQAYEVTAPLPANAAEGAVQNALESLSNLGPVSVSRVTLDAVAGTYAWTVTFLPGSFSSAMCALPPLLIATEALTPAGAATLGASAGPVPAASAVSVRTSADFTTLLRRCDAIRIGDIDSASLLFTISSDAAQPFSDSVLPLASASDCSAPPSGALLNSMDSVPAFYRPTSVSLSPWDAPEFVAGVLAGSVPSLGAVTVSKSVTLSPPGVPDVVPFSITFIGDVAGSASSDPYFNFSAVGGGGLPPLVVNGAGLVNCVGAGGAGGSSLIVSSYVRGAAPDNYGIVFVPASAASGAAVGGGLQSYTLTGLPSGVPIFARVSAGNDRGYGTYASSPARAAVAPPGALSSVELEGWSVTSLLLTYAQTSVDDGGDATLSSFRVEVDSSAAFAPASPDYSVITRPFNSTVQRLTLTSPVAGVGGSFRLAAPGFGGAAMVQVGGPACVWDVDTGASYISMSSYPGTHCTTPSTAGVWGVPLLSYAGGASVTSGAELLSPRESVLFGDVQLRVGDASLLPLPSSSGRVYRGSASDPAVAGTWPNRGLRAQPLFVSSTALGPVSVSQKGSSLLCAWSDGVNNALPGALAVGDLLRFGHPLSGPVFRSRGFNATR